MMVKYPQEPSMIITGLDNLEFIRKVNSHPIVKSKWNDKTQTGKIWLPEKQKPR